MMSPLDNMLNDVEWGEFRIGDLFEINTPKKRFDANKITILKSGIRPYIVRTGLNNGQRGFIEENEKFLNEGNTLSFGQDTATIFYQENSYFTGDKIKIFKSKSNLFNKKNAHFFISSIRRSFLDFSWGSSSFSEKNLQNKTIKLPVSESGSPDYYIMSNFIAELEAERIAELEAYLSVTGMKDVKLTEAEKNALNNLENLSFNSLDILNVFKVNNTKNILSRDIDENSGRTPYLCAGSENNSIRSYISYDEKYLEEGDCIFIGGKTFTVSYQKDNFYSNDSHNLTLRLYKNENKSKCIYLYLATCLRKSLGHKYSWGDSISKAKIRKDKIMLPSVGEYPDFSTMETLISAIQKLVIRDVVDYADQKIAAHKKVTGQT